MEQQAASQRTADPLAALRLMLDESPEQPEPVVPAPAAECEALTDDHLVCGCNNVSAGEIREAMRSRRCATLDDVQVATRAGGGCGHCLPVVAGLVCVEQSRASIG